MLCKVIQQMQFGQICQVIQFASQTEGCLRLPRCLTWHINLECAHRCAFICILQQAHPIKIYSQNYPFYNNIYSTINYQKGRIQTQSINVIHLSESLGHE